MSVFTILRKRWQRTERIVAVGMPGHQGLVRFRPAPAPGQVQWEPLAEPGDAPTQTMPSQVQAAQYDAEARRKVAELAAQVEAEQAQAAAEARQEAGPIASLPPVPLPEPPPMPPSNLSRIMVAQIPPPPVNDRNAEWTHRYADYMRRVGVATGTATDLEHTIAWGMPALQPGDGTGRPL